MLVRESLWGFQILVAIHIMGLALSVGTLAWFDLRLSGLTMALMPVSGVYRRLIPWAAVGFVVMFVSGGLLFIGFAASAYGNVYFRIKLLALASAGVNAAVYHRFTERDLARWDADPCPPLAARLAGGASLLLWTVVILCGRMISYTLY